MARVVKYSSEIPRIVVTTDVNGTTTPHNTFAELVRAEGLFDEMETLMQSYASGRCSFSTVLPRMKHLAGGVDRSRLESYAHEMPLYKGVTKIFDELSHSENIDSKVALSTTGFAGLMALVNKLRHGSLLSVAASPVLVHLLSQKEKSCLIRAITDEQEKVMVIDDLANSHRPNSQLLFHIGDTMGDFVAIKHAAELGGIGICFNPNEALKARIGDLSSELRTRICAIAFAADEEPNYAAVGDIIKEKVWERLRTEI
jgi:phosphoserine phosphatase